MASPVDIDSEITKLRNRIAELERVKEENEKPVNNFEILSEFISDTKSKIQLDRYSKSIKLAKWYDQRLVTYLDAIFGILKDLDSRISNIA
tara:strand:- start:122 stop:394 length:273 start_codon:yes stop_codon:yes gene_type:complete